LNLLQLVLALYDKEGNELPRELYSKVREELVEQFGGVTAFTQSPAVGLWTCEGTTFRDEIVVYEVMTEQLAKEWWRDYRIILERRFKQDAIVIRSQTIQLL
jgi:hypothetical protein